MVQRLDASVPRKKKNGDTFWVKIGAAWPAKKGVGYTVVFDALPIPDSEGRVVVGLFEPKDDNQKQTQEAYNDAPLSDQLNDAVPF